MTRTTPPHRRNLLLAAGGSLVAAGASRAAPKVPTTTDWAALGEEVRAEMAWAWANYAQRALGQDQIKPVSGGVEPFFFPDRPMGLSIVEAFGTLWLMGLESQFEQGLGWVRGHLDFDVDGEVQLFETSIRLMGGLLSGHLASGDGRLLELAHDLGRRLLPAFAKSPTGMPYRYVNLKTGAVRDPHTNPAEVGTYMPEWGTLAKLTGERRFYDVPKAAVKAMFDRRSHLDLLADAINCETGKWESRKATVGPPSDSYYEYLWDAWQLFGDADFKRWYDTCTAATLKWQSDVLDGRLWFAHVDFETGRKLDRRQTELDAFYGGLLGQGGHMAAGRAFTLSWSAVQDKYGVLPEGFDYGTFTATTPSNALRPELADSCINLWLLDRDELWRRIGRTHFRNMQRWNKARYGYTGLKNVIVDPKVQADLCPGYWWSEQMKYYWLLFSDTPRFDYQNNYLSTEGDVLLGFRKA